MLLKIQIQGRHDKELHLRNYITNNHIVCRMQWALLENGS